jgi:hypothetical protein
MLESITIEGLGKRTVLSPLLVRRADAQGRVTLGGPYADRTVAVLVLQPSSSDMRRMFRRQSEESVAPWKPTLDKVVEKIQAYANDPSGRRDIAVSLGLDEDDMALFDEAVSEVIEDVKEDIDWLDTNPEDDEPFNDLRDAIVEMWQEQSGEEADEEVDMKIAGAAVKILQNVLLELTED